MKFRTTLGVFLIVLLGVGCSSETTLKQVNEAIELCAENGGLDFIGSPSNDDVKYIYCVNGARFLTSNTE